MSPKLSIIIPCYNCEQTLREAVESCYKQGFATNEFEIVMVDDGSTDGTYPLMDELSNEYKNIKIFQHEKNQGGGATRNTAVAKTKSEIIFCLDSDDILPVMTLKKMFDYLQKNHCDGVGIHYSINFKGTDITDIDHIVTMSYAGQAIPFENLFQRDNQLCSIYHVFMLTKKAFYKTGGYPIDHGFDTQGFAWRFLSAGLKAHTVPDTFYLLRIGLHESYYLREYNAGRINFNWQRILLEHSAFFTPGIIDFITNFDCSDFTRNLLEEVGKHDEVLRNDYTEYFGTKVEGKNENVSKQKAIHRNSLQGIYKRIKKNF